MTNEERFRQLLGETLPPKKREDVTKEERFQSWLDQPGPPPEPEGMTTWKWIKWAAYVLAPLGLLTALTHDFGIVLMCLGPVMGLVLVFGVLGASSTSPQPEARRLSPDGGVKMLDSRLSCQDDADRPLVAAVENLRFRHKPASD